MPTIRVATYNIRSLRDDRDAVVRVIRELRADVVCIQEAPRLLLWRRRCRQLAAACGMRIIGGGRSAAANLLLADATAVVIETRDVLFSKDFRLHQRGVALAHLQVAGAHLVVAGTHLDGVEEPRLRHIAQLHAAVDAFTPAAVPAVVAADINDVPGSRAWTLLTARGTDAAAERSLGDPLTNPAHTPTRRIDAIFADSRFAVVSCQAIGSPDAVAASDHRPVVAELWAA